MQKTWKTYAVSLAVTLGAGTLSGLLTRNATKAYATMAKPPLSPPGWIFPVVWSILYVLMAVGFGLVYNRSSGQRRQRVTRLYGLQVLVNVTWPFLFFVGNAYLLAFLWLLGLLALVLYMALLFYTLYPPAAGLQIPYILWLCFAGYLNFAVFLLNK